MSIPLAAIRDFWLGFREKVADASNNKERARILVTQVLGIDRAVAWINATGAWSFVRAPLSAFFIITYLSIDQQGLWYTFRNLAALAVFAELGFSMIISQFVSHEYSRLSLTHGHLIGEEYYLDRLVSLVRYAVKFYAIVISLAIVILTTLGFFYFREQPQLVFVAWTFFSVTSGLSLFVGLLQAIYRGLDKVADTQKVSLASMTVATFASWLALYSGLNVWALPIGSGVGALMLLWLVIRLAPKFWLQLYRHRLAQRFSWKREIVWLQGKYALTFASGYFIFDLLVPAVFKIEGPALAGQLGLTMAAVTAIQGFALAPVGASVPKINMLIADNRREECDGLIKRVTISSCLFYLLGAFAFVSGILVFESIGIFRGRFLTPLPLILVVTYQLAPTLTSGASTFLRAHKEEPHLPLAFVQGVLFAVAILTILPRFGLVWLLTIFNLVFWLLAVPWIFLMVADYRKRVGRVP